jgi:hypothetical protein
MQLRALLLFVLFLVLAAFYATMTRQSMSDFTDKQRAQTEAINQLDERALSESENSN